MSRKLVLSDGTHERELQLVGRLVVGRDPSCDISVDHSLLSRRHAEFVTAGEAVTVRDLGSRNGVFVNGSRAAERVLAAGDVVQIGPVRARYVVDDAPLSITPEAFDDDRTAMLRAPLGAGAPALVAAAPSATPSEAAVLPDTVVPQSAAEEDVTRMVPAPAAPPRDEPAPADDQDVTRFTPGPVVADAVAAPSPRIQPAVAQNTMGGVVMLQLVLLAVTAVVATLTLTAVVPGAVGGALAIAGAAVLAAVVAASINRRVESLIERSGGNRS